MQLRVRAIAIGKTTELPVNARQGSGIVCNLPGKWSILSESNMCRDN